MNALITLTMALTVLLTPHAAHAHPGEDILNLSICANVAPIALLAKDNMPYWSESQNIAEKKACYQALKTIAQEATVEEIAQLSEAFDGEVRILVHDADYATFVKAKKTISDSSSEYIVDAQVETLTPVYSPKAIFFQKAPF